VQQPEPDRCDVPSPPSDCPTPPKNNGYTCECTCDGSTTPLRVCVPAGINPNLTDGQDLQPQELMDDCKMRVEAQVQKMDNKCYVPNPSCSCVTATQPDTFYHCACDQGCVSEPLADDCSNWDPKNGVLDATCAPTLCDSPGPVCLTPIDFPDQCTAARLAAGIMGRASQCRIDEALSHVGVTVDGGDTRESPIDGLINFTEAPGGCLAGESCVRMDYRLDTTGTLFFEGTLGFDTEFKNVATIGASKPFALSSTGDGSLPEATTETSGRGTQIDTRPIFPDGVSHPALIGNNGDAIDVFFAPPFCRVHGSLVGNAGDPDGDSVSFDLAVDASGIVENTPPHASLGSDRGVECTSPTGADVNLDATSSTDRENNIVTYVWYLGTRAGTFLGSGSTLTQHQAIGAQTYFVKTIDAFMQADEASATITVGDSTAPTIACNAPATITPSKTPYAFTATASDTCDSGLSVPAIIGFDCFALNGSGKPVARSCKVRVSGPTFTIIDSGGIGDHFRWRERVTDASGNPTLSTCETQVVKKK